MSAVCTTSSTVSTRIDLAARRSAPGAILVAESSPRLAAAIRTSLSANGFTVTVVGDGLSAQHQAASGRFDVVVLDPHLPRLPGVEVLRRLRASGSAMPVVLLSSADNVPSPGAQPRADAYVPKSVPVDVLLAAVRTLVPKPAEPSDLYYGGLRLDLNTREAHVRDYSVRLSAREFALAEAFMRRPGQFLTREYLLEKAWGSERANASNIVEVYIGRLRGKLGIRRIVAQRGVGYRLEEIY